MSNTATTSRYGVVQEFHAGDFSIRLRLPEGVHFLEVTSLDMVLPALKEGWALLVRSKNERAFVWEMPTGKFLADYFPSSPAEHLEFCSPEEAAAYVASLYE